VIITLKKDNITLSGTLSKPYGDRHHPAIILISGSGPNDRDETIFGHKPFLVLSDFLTRNGFAVIRYDKRGVGKSTGEYNKATIRDFANDAAAVVDFAKSRKDIDPANIHVIGHSEGGLIAAMLASQNPNIRSVVSMAGPGGKGLEIVQDQNRVSMQAQKIEPETIDKLLKLNHEILQGIMEWHGTENERTTLRNQLGVLWEQLPILVKMKMKKDVLSATIIMLL
jgi:pimeloyl-ACP methyl ester carboxylesterase